MEFKINPYIVYIKTNDFDYVTDINSSAFLTDTTDWVEIDRGHGDKYHHAQNHYLQKPIYTIGGVYRYKLVDGKLVECSVEEIAEQEEANKSTETPSQLDIIESKVTYMAMMTGLMEVL